MWRDTGQSRYLADALRRNPLPLTNCRLADFENGRELGNAACSLDRLGGHVQHKRKISGTYIKVNEAFAAPAVRPTYYGRMFKETIKRLRRAKGLTQKQVAERMGLTAPAVTQWEAGGGIDTDNLTKLAKALETPVEVLARALEQDGTSRNSSSTPQNLPDSNTRSGNNTHVGRSARHEEGTNMGDHLRDRVLGDILTRLQRIEDRLASPTEEPGTPTARPRKRRRV